MPAALRWAVIQQSLQEEAAGGGAKGAGGGRGAGGGEEGKRSQRWRAAGRLAASQELGRGGAEREEN